jgi:hypothetical protein
MSSKARTETFKNLSRVFHAVFGLGVVLEHKLTESGRDTVLVRFDLGTERQIVTEFLAASTEPLLPEAPKAPKRRATKKKLEDIPDDLLVPDREDVGPVDV